MSQTGALLPSKRETTAELQYSFVCLCPDALATNVATIAPAIAAVARTWFNNRFRVVPGLRHSDPSWLRSDLKRPLLRAEVGSTIGWRRIRHFTVVPLAS